YPARVSRSELVRAEIMFADVCGWPCSQAPAGMQRNDAARHRRIRNACEASVADHCGESLRLRKLADGFDKIAIGLSVARDRSAKRRDHIERIEIVQRFKRGHIDRR